MIEMLELCVVSNVLPCELMKVGSMPKRELGEHMEERKQRAADQRLGSNFLPPPHCDISFLHFWLMLARVDKRLSVRPLSATHPTSTEMSGPLRR
jgi:hypothetical protein